MGPIFASLSTPVALIYGVSNWIRTWRFDIVESKIGEGLELRVSWGKE